MPSATDESKSSSFYLPSVDISPYLEDPSSAAAGRIVDDIREACLSTGFFQLLGHGVPKSLQNSVFQAAAKFFALPLDTKVALSAKNPGYRGYDIMASQSYEADVLPDLKEGFFMGHDLSPDHPHVQAKRYFAGPNAWPPSEVLAPEDFQRPCERYHEAMMRLSEVVLALVASTLPYGPRIFDEFRGPEPACPLRLLHYPPTTTTTASAKGGAGKRQLGASAHTDFSCVTLLLQDEHEGLEVLDESTQSWVLVPPNPAAYVVNLGDMMSKMTQGRYKSGMHRVLNRNRTDRYSVVFFHDGNLDCKLRPLGSKMTTDGGRDKDEDEGAMTAEEYMYDRMNFSYSKHENPESV